MEIDIYGTGNLCLIWKKLSGTYNVRNLFSDIRRVICQKFLPKFSRGSIGDSNWNTLSDISL